MIIEDWMFYGGVGLLVIALVFAIIVVIAFAVVLFKQFKELNRMDAALYHNHKVRMANVLAEIRTPQTIPNPVMQVQKQQSVPQSNILLDLPLPLSRVRTEVPRLPIASEIPKLPGEDG